MNLNYHLAAARKHLQAVERLASRRQAPAAPSAWPPPPPEGDRWSTREEIAAACSKLRQMFSQEQ